VYSIADLDPAQLPPLPDAAGWADRRASIDRIWREYVGTLPDPISPSYQVMETSTLEGVELQRIRYVAPGDEVSAYLLTPPGDPQRRPAVLALHQTADIGKDEVIGKGRKTLKYGLELAQRGYVVLAPDTVTRGERIHPGDKPHDSIRFYSDNPGWTTVGRMATDHRQGISLLQSLPTVDPERIGAIGHSLGGYNSFFLAGLDERIGATVCSCGLGMFAQDPTPERWCRDDFFNHIPRIRQDLDAGTVKWEWHEILALVAPRPMFIWWTRQDDCFPNAAALEAGVNAVHGLYDELGAGAAMQSMAGDGAHDFPLEARTAAYEFFDEKLGRS
jgi:dienelactone hydrolase